NGNFAAEADPHTAVRVARIVSGNHFAIQPVITLVRALLVDHFVIARRRRLVTEGERKSPRIQLAQQQRQFASREVHLPPEWTRHDLDLRPRYQHHRVTNALAVYVLQQPPGNFELLSDVE